MDNFGHATEATETALNSAGSAARENARYMESLEAKVSAVQASFQQLSTSVIDSGLVKAILDLANGFLQLANTGIGPTIVQFTLLTGLLWGGSSLISAMDILPTMIGQITNAFNLMTGSTTAANLAAAAFKGTSLEAAAAAGTLGKAATAMGATLSIALPLAAAIAAVTIAIIGLIKAYQDGHPSVEEMNTQLEENKARLEEINKIPWNQRTDEIEAERQRLEAENEELEKNIDLRERRGKSIMQDVISNPEYKQQSYAARVKVGNTGKYKTFEADSLDELTQKMIKAGVVAEDFDGDFASLGITVQRTTKSFSDVIPSMDQNIDRYQELQNKIDAGIPLTAEENEEYVRLGQTIQNYVSDINDAIDAGETVAVTHRNMAKRGEEVTSSFDETNKKLAEQNDLLGQVAQGMAITNGSYQQLITLYPELINYIDQGNYGWTLNVEALANAAAAGDAWAISMIEDVINVAEAIEMLDAMFNRAFKQAESSGSPYASQMKEANAQSQYLANLNKLKDAAQAGKNKNNNYGSLYPGTTSSASSASSGASTDPIEKQTDAFDEQNAIIEHNIYLKEKNGATIQELIEANRNYQKTLNEEANWYRAQGLDDSAQQIRDLQQQWWDLEDTITDLQRQAFDERLQISENYINEHNDLANWGADNEIAAWERVLKWMDEWYNQGVIDYEYYLEQRQEALEKYNQAVKDAAQEQMSNIETAFNYIINKAQDQIDDLNDRRQQIQDYYDEQIEALQQTNDELEDQIAYEEALDQLARARQTNVMVYKDGRFQYVQDIDAVSEAQENLDELERQRKLEEEVRKLEEIRDRELAAIDDQIEYWEKYKDEWTDLVNQFTDEQDRMIAELVFGTDLEQENWETRLGNLRAYVDEYIALLEELERAQQQAALGQAVSDASSIIAGSIGGWLSGASGGSSKGSSGVSIRPSGSSGTTTAWVPGTGTITVNASGGSTHTSGLPTGTVVHTQGGNYEIVKPGTSGATYNPNSGYWSVKKDATGTLSSEGGMRLVGEEGPELRVLNEGDGVLPAGITKNLWTWGATKPSDFISKITGLKNGMSNMMNVTIQNLNLPGVQNGQDFVNYMRNNFWRETVQFQTS